jgi:hypothetical protein
MAKRRPVSSDALASVVPVGEIEQRILLIRGQRIILAGDLARMYGIPVKQLNRAVGRNANRFPEDFVFQLTRNEAVTASRFQFGTLNKQGALTPQNRASKRGSNLKYLPYAFTEHGALMAANLLKSPQAAKVSVYVVRAFVKLRELLSTHRELSVKLNQLESKLQNHDGQIIALINAIRSLMEAPAPPAKPRIGFETEKGKTRK